MSKASKGQPGRWRESRDSAPGSTELRHSGVRTKETTSLANEIKGKLRRSTSRLRLIKSSCECHVKMSMEHSNIMAPIF